jgi:replicative DNA helicase
LKDAKKISAYGNIPPQAVEMEEVLLGAFLLDKESHEIIDTCEVEYFYKLTNQLIFSVIKSLRNEKKSIDILTVTNELNTSGKLSEAGGALYITQLTFRVASGAHCMEHFLVILEKYIARETIRMSAEMIEMAYSDCDIEELETKILELKTFYETKTLSQGNGEMIYDVAAVSLTNSKQRISDRQNGTMPGINTGFGMLQDLTGGWQPGDLIFIAARPSMGKTALSIHFAKQAAISGCKVLFFSLEMNAISITDRFVLGKTGIDPEKWRNGTITNFDLALYSDEQKLLKSTKLIIYDKSSIRPSYINTVCKREKPDLVVIDYIQLMKPNQGEKFQNRNLELGSISHELKVIAKDYNVPVIVLSQLNRRLDTSASKEPTLSDLRDSGELEQDADLVIFPFRPYVYDTDSPGLFGIMNLFISKHRNGRTGKIYIKHNEYINNFYEENNGFADVESISPKDSF